MLDTTRRSVSERLVLTDPLGGEAMIGHGIHQVTDPKDNDASRIEELPV